MRVLPSWLWRSLQRGYLALGEILIGNPPPSDGGGGTLPSDNGSDGGGTVVIVVDPPPVPVYVQYLTVKITGNPHNVGKNVKAIIYDDNGGKPLASGGLGQTYTITAPDLDGSIQLSFYLPPTLTGGTYLIGVWTDGTVEFYGTDGTSLAVAGDPAGSFSSTPTTKTKKLSVVATATTVQPAPPPPNASATFVKSDSRSYRADLR